MVGGPEPAAYIEEYLDAGADVVVIGEGEVTLEELLPALASVRTGHATRAQALASVPLAGPRGGRTSHPRTTVSSPPVNSRPSGPNARAVTRSRCPRNSARTVHVAVSQSRTIPSADAVARVRPSGANAAFVAPGRGPAVRVATARPVAASQT